LGWLRLALQPVPLVLSLSKDERVCSWFDTLTTSGDVQPAFSRLAPCQPGATPAATLDTP
jgi:hypothetical protein